jgi:AcrR family transcriptional regulator
MTSVREKRHVMHQTAIYAAALTLFDSQGYEKTSLEQIADRANLGVGTVYNYFDSKLDLLTRLLINGLKEQCKRAAVMTEIAKPPLTDALLELAAHYAGLVYTYRKDLWRHMLAGILTGEVENAETGEVGRQFKAQITSLVARLAPAAPRQGPLVDVIWACMTVRLFSFISSHEPLADDALAHFREELKSVLVFDSSQKIADARPEKNG